MTRLDLSGLRDLWYRIDDIFARLSEAIGSITFSGTTLSWYFANGTFSDSIDLDTVFAKDTEAAGSMVASGDHSLQLKNVSGSNLGSTVDVYTLLSDDFGVGLSVSGSTLYLDNANGSHLDSAPLPSTGSFATKSQAIGDVSIKREGNSIVLRAWTVDGTLVYEGGASVID